MSIPFQNLRKHNTPTHRRHIQHNSSAWVCEWNFQMNRSLWLIYPHLPSNHNLALWSPAAVMSTTLQKGLPTLWSDFDTILLKRRCSVNLLWYMYMPLVSYHIRIGLMWSVILLCICCLAHTIHLSLSFSFPDIDWSTYCMASILCQYTKAATESQLSSVHLLSAYFDSWSWLLLHNIIVTREALFKINNIDINKLTTMTNLPVWMWFSYHNPDSTQLHTY